MIYFAIKTNIFKFAIKLFFKFIHWLIDLDYYLKGIIFYY
jgi:hypothetical protein